MASQLVHSLISIMKRIKEILKKFQGLDQRDLEVFISEILDRDKSFVISHWEQELSLFQYLKLLYFIYQRKQGYSVAAIIGHKEFYNLDFFVNKKVLIPRPETELVVEEAIGILNNELRTQNDQTILIDVGTGSGCIPISILKNIKEPIQTFAIDISKYALWVAKKNAKKHNVNINFRAGNLLEPILKSYRLQANTLIITANLPYLTEQQFQAEPSIQQEPKNALVAEKQGLALYEELLKQIKSQLLIVSCSWFIFLEIDPSQTKAALNLIQQILPEANFEIKKDLAGLDRLVKITNS